MSGAISVPSDDFAASFGPLLDKMPASLAPFIKDATEKLHRVVLEEVEDYIRSNVEWNIGNRLDSGAKAEALNVALLEAMKDIAALEGECCGVPVDSEAASHFAGLVQRAAAIARATGAA